MRLLTSAAVLLAAPSTALACGGFFCNQAQPIDQSAERIVFSIEEGKVEAHVQVAYEGEAERFAWVVPVPGVPEVGLSSDVLFQRLEAMTRPRFLLTQRWLGDCTGGGFGGGSNNGGNSGGMPPGSGDGLAGGPDVVVVAEGQAGPYDYRVVTARSHEALVAWLADPDGDPTTADGYDLPPAAASKIGLYVSEQAHFVAFKLVAGARAGDIAPIVLQWPGARASIPLVLTSVAATPDMRLEAYVLGAHRAVPLSYLHVEINEAAVDWFRGGDNYDALITLAADEAGGQAFATDAFVELAPVAASLTAPSREAIEALADEVRVARFLSGLWSQGVPLSPVTLGILRRHLPLPADVLAANGLTDVMVYGAPSPYAAALQTLPFDPAAVIAELEERVTGPLRRADALLDRHRYVTRLRSSVSPEEMTVDPLFGLAPHLGGALVPTDRQAELLVDCTEEPSLDEAPKKLVLPDGAVVPLPADLGFGPDGYGGWMASLGMPASVRAARTYEDRGAQPVYENVEAIAGILASLDGRPDTAGDGGDDSGGPGLTPGEAVACGGCAQGGGGGVVALLALLGWRRRR